MKRWFPPHVREMAQDVDYLDRLSPAARAWYERFQAEYYNGEPGGISSPEHLTETHRRRGWSLKHDLFAAGLRASSDEALTSVASEPTAERDEALESPEARRLLTELRRVRPEFDATDGRRRARFASPLHERRFNQLQAQLLALLETAR